MDTMRSLLLMAVLLSVHGDAQASEAADAMRESVMTYLQGRKLHISTAIMDPYMIGRNISGSVTYEGFTPDVLNKLGDLLEFQWEFSSITESPETAIESLKAWQEGDRAVEMAALPLPVSTDLLTDVSPLPPLQHENYVMVTRNQVLTPSVDYLLVLRPFTTTTWVIILLMPFVIAFTIWVINKLMMRYGDVDNQEKFDITGALWFTLTTMHWQGFDRVPGPVGARVLAYTWFGFCSFMLMTYIASIVNQYNWSELSQVIQSTGNVKSFTDVIHDNERIFLVIDDSPSNNYLRQYLQKADISFPLQSVTMVKAVAKVLEDDKYILLSDSSMAEYMTSTHCGITITGDTGISVSLTFALPKDHPLKQALDYGVIKLRETGELEAIRQKWFDKQGSCPARQQRYTHIEPTVKPLDMVTMAIPTVVVGLGVVVGLLLTGLDILLIKYRGKGFHNTANTGKQQQE